MEIFKLFESTIGNVQPGHSSLKDLRRDQVLDRYDEASKSLKTLIQSKESEIVFRRNLIDMLEKSKQNYDNKLAQTRQAYQSAKKYVAVHSDSNSQTPTKKSNDSQPPYTSPPSSSNQPPPALYSVPSIPGLGPTSSSPPPLPPLQQPAQPQLMHSANMNNTSMESLENRTSLDQRLNEFRKTFPNLRQF